MGKHLADLVLIRQTLGMVRVVIRVAGLHLGEGSRKFVIHLLDLVRHISGEVFGFLNVNALTVVIIKLIEFKRLGSGIVDMVVITHQLEAAHTDRAF